jgi:hypothetical protein
MNQNTPTDDQLDGLLSDFFKAEMKTPWPAAPATAPVSAPAAQAPAQNQPAARDESRKSRYTLAASVALLLGTCWALSNGFQPAERATPGGAGTGGGLNLNSTSADGKNSLPGAIKDGQDKPAVAPPKVDTKIDLP